MDDNMTLANAVKSHTIAQRPDEANACHMWPISRGVLLGGVSDVEQHSGLVGLTVVHLSLFGKMSQILSIPQNA